MLVCLFDIDGTLINSGGAGTAALRSALRSAFNIAEPTDKVSVHGRTDRSITRDLFQHHGIPENEENSTAFRTAYLQHLPEMLSARPGRICPGITELLLELRRRGDIAIGLLTGNIAAGARIKLRHFGLDEHFAFGGFGDTHPSRDDVAREAFEAARKHHGSNLQIEKTWVIGDTPLDVQCARAIGARALAVATGDHSLDVLAETKPDHLATDLTDINELFRVWGI